MLSPNKGNDLHTTSSTTQTPDTQMYLLVVGSDGLLGDLSRISGFVPSSTVLQHVTGKRRNEGECRVLDLDGCTGTD